MKFFWIILSVICLLVASLFIGAVHIEPGQVLDALLRKGDDDAVNFIILGSRFPQAMTALLAGAALAVSGLMMQTMFRNPLAGPSILGISSGANLGVALVMLLMGSTVTIGSLAFSGYVSIIIGAFAGSILIMGLLILLSTVLRNDLMLIITGVLIGYLTSSIITLLNYSASAHGVQSYIMWGMGTFNSVSLNQLPVFAIIVVIGLILSLILVKPLNALLLGDDYARSLGIPIKTVRNLLLLATGILTAVTTAFCGPVAFIGLAVPHIARMIWRTDNHRVLMPATMLVGSAVALLCCIISVLPSAGIAPINAVTPLIGVPVILYVVIRRR
ncbi:MAG: iron ABC transporter permease [Muribaculaceae bacterium]|nr:iron ABC transporter permease [Muribaculaceae bacterium]MDE6522970.1 iron ABC transporter permease [Muribaculaceae bacterium]